MHIDVKNTIWKRIYIPEYKNNLVTSKIKSNISLEDIVSELYCDNEIYYEYICETEEIMSPENNEATIEVFDSVNNLIYSNSKNN